MQASELQTLIDYNYWSNARLINATKKLTPEQLEADAGLSYGSIKETLVHVMAAEIVWRSRFAEGTSPERLLNGSDFPTFDDALNRWQQEETAMRAFAATLTDESGGRIVQYQTFAGKAQAQPLWQLLVHLVNHGTQTRSEAGVALARLGQSPGDIDFILYLRERIKG
jgi:uncharacterized damage-inducible protein DinB